jgi:hypothetical protein
MAMEEAFILHLTDYRHSAIPYQIQAILSAHRSRRVEGHDAGNQATEGNYPLITLHKRGSERIDHGTGIYLGV